jgi:hypothetical protein
VRKRKKDEKNVPAILKLNGGILVALEQSILTGPILFNNGPIVADGPEITADAVSTAIGHSQHAPAVIPFTCSCV